MVLVERPAKRETHCSLIIRDLSATISLKEAQQNVRNFKLGSGMFIPGFEEQLVGATPGEKKDVTVTFPEDYHAEDLAGKEAVFHCLVHEIKERTAS